jgi:hypothetical protein
MAARSSTASSSRPVTGRSRTCRSAWPNSCK